MSSSSPQSLRPKGRTGTDGIDGSDGELVLLSTVTASSDTSIDFGSLDTTTYKQFLIVFDNVQPATDAVELLLRVSTDRGSTWDSGASDYGWGVRARSSIGGNLNAASAADTAIKLSSWSAGFDLGNAANETLSGYVRYLVPDSNAWSSTPSNHFICFTSYIDSDGEFVSGPVCGYRDTTSIVDGIRFIMSSGNVLTGNFKLYGLA